MKKTAPRKAAAGKRGAAAKVDKVEVAAPTEALSAPEPIAPQPIVAEPGATIAPETSAPVAPAAEMPSEPPVPAPQFVTVTIENVEPLVDGGRYPIKLCVGQDLTVEADVYMAGHDVVAAALKWRVRGRPRWSETAMAAIPNGQDRWRGVLSVFENADHEFTIEAWVDAFRSWQLEFRKKFEGGVQDLTSETIEGAHLVESAAARAEASGSGAWDASRLREIARKITAAEPKEVNEIARWGELEGLMAAWPDRSQTTEYQLAAAATQGGYPRLMVDRERALYAAWYEFFPRSAEGLGDRGSTFRDCLNRIDDA